MYKALLLFALLPVGPGGAGQRPSSSPAGSPTDRSGSIADTDEQRIDDPCRRQPTFSSSREFWTRNGHVKRAFAQETRDTISSPASRAPGLVTRADIMEFDEKQQTPSINAGPAPCTASAFIHGGDLSRASGGTGGSCTATLLPSLPFGVTGILPASDFAYGRVFCRRRFLCSRFRDVAGPDNGMLVSDQRLGGGAGPRSLGTSPVVFDAWPRNGLFTGPTGPACRGFRAIYTQLNAQVELEALRLGPVTYLNAQEAARVDAVNEGDSDCRRNARQWAAVALPGGGPKTGGPGENLHAEFLTAYGTNCIARQISR